jgi:hypothetical protein
MENSMFSFIISILIYYFNQYVSITLKPTKLNWQTARPSQFFFCLDGLLRVDRRGARAADPAAPPSSLADATAAPRTAGATFAAAGTGSAAAAAAAAAAAISAAAAFFSALRKLYRRLRQKSMI